jgi:hypothetical protein
MDQTIAGDRHVRPQRQGNKRAPSAHPDRQLAAVLIEDSERA